MTKPTKMHDLMIDIETMGTKPYSAIVSIGACFFDIETGDIGPKFYEVVSIDSCQKLGMNLDAATMQWWMKQDEAAKKIFFGFKRPVIDVMKDFQKFCSEYVSKKVLRPWGNGSSFDITLMESAFELTGVECPWNFWNVRDVRTIVALGSGISDAKNTIKREGTYHNALDDAIHQVKYVSEIYRTLRAPHEAENEKVA